jgi:hypothetical protein
VGVPLASAEDPLAELALAGGVVVSLFELKRGGEGMALPFEETATQSQDETEEGQRGGRGVAAKEEEGVWPLAEGVATRRQRGGVGMEEWGVTEVERRVGGAQLPFGRTRHLKKRELVGGHRAGLRGGGYAEAPPPQATVAAALARAVAAVEDESVLLALQIRLEGGWRGERAAGQPRRVREEEALA